jgi:hypothetical protein
MLLGHKGLNITLKSFSYPQNLAHNMNNLFKGLIAGYGAMKLGGGCLGTIVVFVIIWVVLGQCS